MDEYPFTFQDIAISEYENDPDIKVCISQMTSKVKWNYVLHDIYTKFTKQKTGFERVGPHKFVAPKGGQDVIKHIYNMKVTEKDIWVVTYPRSGTTWTHNGI